MVVEESIKVAAEGFSQNPNDEGFRGDVARHVLKAPELYLAFLNNKCISFAAIEHFEVEGISVLYLGGVMVRETYQARGLMRNLIAFEIDESKPQVLVARTQNPCVFDLMRKFCDESNLYPYGGPPRLGCRTVSKFMISKMGNIDLDTLIGNGTYGRCLYGDGVPQSKHSESNRFFERIDADKGDSILLVGEVKYDN